MIENITGTIFGRVKGGFTVDIDGVVAFLPGSQADVRPIKDPTTIMDIPQPFQILKMDRKLGNIVVSRKAILEEARSEASAGSTDDPVDGNSAASDPGAGGAD